MCRECGKCSKASYCKGLIIEIFNSIEKDTHNFLMFMAKQYMPMVIKDGIEIDEELIYDVYNISRQNLVNTAFFSFITEWMLSKPPIQSYAYWLKQRYKNETLTNNFGSNALYKKRVRYFKSIEKINYIPANKLMHCNYDFFDLQEFMFKYRFNRHWREDINCSTEHNRIFVKDIFKCMYGYVYPSDNNYRLPEYRNDLKRIDRIYEDIQGHDVSYFTKCLYYAHVEHFLHYEMAYKFVSFLNKRYPEITDEDKKIVLFNEALLRSGKTEDGVLIEYPFLLERENFIVRFFDEYDFNQEEGKTDKSPTEIAVLLMHLSIVANQSVQSTKEKFKHELGFLTNFHISECEFAESIFKGFIGLGQHIVQEKELNDKIIKDIMEIYSNSERVDNKIVYRKQRGRSRNG